MSAGGESLKRAVILLSGGLDSAVALAVARNEGFECHALSIDYSQRHGSELDAARAVARSLGARHTVVAIDLRAIGGSALTDSIDVPKDRGAAEMDSEIPITYVPARNLVFLSLACGAAEAVGARDVFIGVNAVDYSGYPDCRPAFIRSFEETAALGTKAGIEGNGLRVRTPLVELPKHEIIQLGTRLGVDFSLTRSCYDPAPGGLACGRCDSCLIRARGFQRAGVPDPTRYAGGDVPA